MKVEYNIVEYMVYHMNNFTPYLSHLWGLNGAHES